MFCQVPCINITDDERFISEKNGSTQYPSTVFFLNPKKLSHMYLIFKYSWDTKDEYNMFDNIL